MEPSGRPRSCAVGGLSAEPPLARAASEMTGRGAQRRPRSGRGAQSLRTLAAALVVGTLGPCGTASPFAVSKLPCARPSRIGPPSAASSQSDIGPVPFYDATLVNETFRELYRDRIPEWLLDRCEQYGYTHPTLIQQRSLDTFFDDEPNSMVVQAQTGSGKTLTYLLPLLAQLEDRAAIQAMIIVPTRELGLQVATVAKRLAARRFMIMSILQGSQHRRQRAWAWAETPHVVIGTPPEMLNMVQHAGLPRINSVEYVVVDEVDACLVHNSNVGVDDASSNGSATNKPSTSESLNQLLSKFLSPTFLEEEDFIDAVSATAASTLTTDLKRRKRRKFRYRRTVFCSATIPQHRHFLKQCKANQWTLEEPVFVCTSPGESLPPTLQHAYVVCNSKDKKLAAMRRIVQKIHAGNDNSKILVFCDSSRRPMEEMSAAIAHDLNGTYCSKDRSVQDLAGPVITVLRYEDSLSQRATATAVFSQSDDHDNNNNNGTFRLMFTTDLAARGLDIAGITHVLHFDLPRDADTYLHRSGRAGRLGRHGRVISILTPDQEFVLERLMNALMLNDQVTCIGRQKRGSRRRNGP